MAKAADDREMLDGNPVGDFPLYGVFNGAGQKRIIIFTSEKENGKKQI